MSLLFGQSSNQRSVVEVFYSREPELQGKRWVISNPFGSDYYNSTKSEAVKKARQIAKNNRPSSLYILNKDGSRSDKHRYD